MNKDIINVLFTVTTYNRLRYLKSCISTFIKTKSPDLNYTVIIADDGSTDGTLQYLETLNIHNTPIIVIKNSKSHITRQTNSIFEVCQYLNYDFGFKVDDDVYFLESGWDTLYINAYNKYKYGHLVYHNQECKWGQLKAENEDLISHTNANDSMGCLFTFVPDMFEKVGYFDEENFKGPGYSHIEYTVRCCRAKFNCYDKLYDIKNSNKYIQIRCPKTDPSYWSVKTTSYNPNSESYKNYVLRHPEIIKKEHIERPKNIFTNIPVKFNSDIGLINKIEVKNQHQS